LILLSSVRKGNAFCTLSAVRSRGYISPSKYHHIPEFTNLPTSGKEAEGKIAQPAKAWRKPVKRHQMAPRGVKPSPHHLTSGRDASLGKPTGVGAAQGVPLNPDKIRGARGAAGLGRRSPTE